MATPFGIGLHVGNQASFRSTRWKITERMAPAECRKGLWATGFTVAHRVLVTDVLAGRRVSAQ